MNELSHLVIAAIGLGIAYNAAPGAVNTEALRRGLARGARPALLVQLGALIGDLLWAALALTGTAFLAQRQSVRFMLGLAGACFLLRLAWNALHEAWRGGTPRASGSMARGDFATGAFFSLANPFALAFWTGIGSGFAATGSGMSGRFVVLFAGFAFGATLWCLSIPVLIGWERRFVRPALFRWLNALCGLALGYFGLALLWRTIHEIVEHALASASSAGRDAALRSG
jgi:threonine/homoserine/homoserine lactone efflux protein